MNLFLCSSFLWFQCWIVNIKIDSLWLIHHFMWQIRVMSGLVAYSESFLKQLDVSLGAVTQVLTCLICFSLKSRWKSSLPCPCHINKQTIDLQILRLILSYPCLRCRITPAHLVLHFEPINPFAGLRRWGCDSEIKAMCIGFFSNFPLTKAQETAASQAHRK